MRWASLGLGAVLGSSLAACSMPAGQDFDVLLQGLRHDRRQDLGACGPDNGNRICPGQSCCSMYGYCGDSIEHCNQFSCQPNYGACEGKPAPSPTATPTPTPTPSTTSTTSTSTTSTRSTTTSTSSTVVVPSTSSTTTASTSVATPSGGLVISANGLCGNNTICLGSGAGDCCSRWLYCGSGSAFCGDGCRPEFGRCSGSVSSSAASTPTSVSTSVPTPSGGLLISADGTCGNGTTCLGSGAGDCCSRWFYCSNSPEYCGNGCRPEFGRCEGPVSSSTASTPSAVTPTATGTSISTAGPSTVPTSAPFPGMSVSTDGVCGNTTTCAGSRFGSCCSKWLYCGSDQEHCGDGCREGLGRCGDVTDSSGALGGMTISVSGLCGNTTTCAGSAFGSCCSKWLYCGSDQEHCGDGCREGLGRCGGV